MYWSFIDHSLRNIYSVNYLSPSSAAGLTQQTSAATHILHDTLYNGVSVVQSYITLNMRFECATTYEQREDSCRSGNCISNGSATDCPLVAYDHCTVCATCAFCRPQTQILCDFIRGDCAGYVTL